MFDKILIANRGEIALRVLRACKELGIPTVAVHSTADADAMHVRFADESVCIGPPAAKDSYLNIPALLAACEITGADAVHPGYGFLSENARFAEILAEHSVHFIGPKAEHIRLMGDKIEAKRTAKRLGIPVRAGLRRRRHLRRRSAQDRARHRLSGAGQGGGRRRRARHEGRALDGRACRPRCRPRAPKPRPRSATTRSISRNICRSPRHIEIQVLGDGKGNAIHLGERDCSLQRRHQKVWRKAPRPRSTPQRATRSARPSPRRCARLQYLGVGTVEFLYEDGEFYFIEMNTRIQVEHPVTEMITDIDLDLRADPRRRRRRARAHAERRRIPRPRHRVPHQCREPGHPSGPRPARSCTIIRPAGWACASIRRSIRATPSRRIYDSLVGKLIVHGKTPHRMPDAAQARARRVRGRRHRDDAAAVPRAGARARTSSTATITSTGSSSSSPAAGWRAEATGGQRCWSNSDLTDQMRALDTALRR